MNDRDTFAAAALPACHAAMIRECENRGYPSDWRDQIVRDAYEYADAMLREREQTKHNAGRIVRSRDTASGVASPPVSSGGTINRSAESQSPDAKCGGGEPLDVPQADNAQAAGGRGHHIPVSRTRLSEAEIDAIDYVVEEGRIACVEDCGVLRSLLVRVRPEWATR